MVSGMRRVARKSVAIGVLMMGSASNVPAQIGSYGPYRVTGYNYTDRSIALFVIDDFGAGGSQAHQSGGGGGTVCCMSVPRTKKTWHIKILYELTQEQYRKDLPNDVYETDIPVPPLPNKHDGYIEFHFLPEHRIDAQWVIRLTRPRIPNTTSNASSTTN